MAAAERNLEAAQSSSDASAITKRLRVLVVDDERDTVLTLTQLLADEGYYVRGVYKGRDALETIGDFDPDVVLVDLALPDMSGWEVARQVRIRHGDERPTLISISGKYKQASDKVLGKLAGFNHGMEKPCDPQALLGLLAKL